MEEAAAAPPSEETTGGGNPNLEVGYGIHLSAYAGARIDVAYYGDPVGGAANSSGSNKSTSSTNNATIHEVGVGALSDHSLDTKVESSSEETEDCCKNFTITTKIEHTLIKYINLLGAKLEVSTAAGTIKGKGDAGITTTNGGPATYSTKVRLTDISSISLSYDKYGDLTGVSGQISFGGVTMSESLSKGTYNAEISVKKGENFNSIKGSYTRGVAPSSFPRVVPLPSIPIPIPRYSR